MKLKKFNGKESIKNDGLTVNRGNTYKHQTGIRNGAGYATGSGVNQITLDIEGGGSIESFYTTTGIGKGDGKGDGKLNKRIKHYERECQFEIQNTLRPDNVGAGHSLQPVQSVGNEVGVQRHLSGVNQIYITDDTGPKPKQ